MRPVGRGVLRSRPDGGAVRVGFYNWGLSNPDETSLASAATGLHLPDVTRTPAGRRHRAAS